MARYRQLRQTLAAEIAAGQPPVGARFPTDLELCARFGVSRHTVREALRELQDQGLLVRQRGSGTVVAAPGAKAALSPTVGWPDDLDAAAFEKLSEGVVVARPALADLLGCPAETKWLRLVGLRRGERAADPLAWSEVYIAEPYISARGQFTAGPEPHHEQLGRLFGVVVDEVEQTISAVAIPADIAAPLNATAGGPALLVRRRYFAGGPEPVEVTLSIHPAGRYTHTQRLSRARLGKP